MDFEKFFAALCGVMFFGGTILIVIAFMAAIVFNLGVLGALFDAAFIAIVYVVYKRM